MNAFRLQVHRDGRDINHIGQADMKPGVETGDLGNVGTVRVRRTDERQRRRRVQRREGRGGFKWAQHRSVDSAMLAQCWPAMHDAVPDGV